MVNLPIVAHQAVTVLHYDLRATHTEWRRAEQVGGFAPLTIAITPEEGVQRFHSFAFRKVKKGEYREY